MKVIELTIPIEPYAFSSMEYNSHLDWDMDGEALVFIWQQERLNEVLGYLCPFGGIRPHYAITNRSSGSCLRYWLNGNGQFDYFHVFSLLSCVVVMAIPTFNSYFVRMSLRIFKDIHSSASWTMMLYCIKATFFYLILTFPISINNEQYNKRNYTSNNISE